MNTHNQRTLLAALGMVLGLVVGIVAADGVTAWQQSRRYSSGAAVAPIGVLYTTSGNGPFQVAEVLTSYAGVIAVRTTDGGEVVTTNGTLVLYAPGR